MSASQRFRIVAAMATLALFGFGCRQPVRTSVPPLPLSEDSVSAPAQPAAETGPRKPDTEYPTPPEVLVLQNAFQNLAAARSYRATLSIPGDPKGLVTGELEMNRESGWHGTLTSPGAPKAELYVFGPDVYVRSGTSTWTNVGASDEGTQLAAFFRAAMSNGPEDDASAVSISKYAKILSVTDDPEPCRLYSLSQSAPDGSTISYSVCVANNLPARMSVQTPAGPLLITYRDVNADIVLWPPSN